MHKKGFTLVEVALFLALSGLLVASVIAGTSRSIASKRFDDTVDNFVSYLENLYASVNYVRGSVGGGKNSDQAVYGKLINMTQNGGKTTFSSYTVLSGANTKNVSSNDALTALGQTCNKACSLNGTKSDVTNLKRDEGGTIPHEDFLLSWGGSVMAQEDKDSGETNQILLLIIRHPRNGTNATYVYYPTPTSPVTIDGSFNLANTISSGSFETKDANFCVDSNDRWAGGDKRRLVRIHAGANNSSGVELIGNEKKESEGFCL